MLRTRPPGGSISFGYDAFGNLDARVFTSREGGLYIESHTVHADGSPATLDLLVPDTGFADEHVDYDYDSAGRGRSVTYGDGSTTTQLYHAQTVDPFGRVRQAQYGPTSYAASYADIGRRLIGSVAVSSPLGSRAITYQGFDPVGRERSRTEAKDGGAPATSSYGYDALGRLLSAVRPDGTSPFDQQFSYDPLGNLLAVVDHTGGPGTTLTYHTIDRDRICRISYGSDSGTACNVTYDQIGNIVSQVTRTGTRQLGYYADGNVRSISDETSTAQIVYDAFGEVQKLDLTSSSSNDTRHDRRYGLVEQREVGPSDARTTIFTRTIPGPDGFVATRQGSAGPWLFAFGEARANRFFTDGTGAFVQDVDYRPYGEATSTGAQPGSLLYSREQWNGGDALTAFGLSHLGARLYDPVVGRFLSRDPLLIPRTAATTNPYAFAMNDPVNGSDPTGLDCKAMIDSLADCPGLKSQPGKALNPTDFIPYGSPYNSDGGYTAGSYSVSHNGGNGSRGGSSGYTPPDVQILQYTFETRTQVEYALNTGMSASDVAYPIVTEALDQVVDMLPLIGTYRAFERGDMVGFALGLAGDLVLVGKIVRVGRAVLVVGNMVARDGVVAGEAGRFADLRARSVVGDRLTPHHIPQSALNFTSHADGGALVMTADEHVMTRTYGAKGAATARTEAEIGFRDVLARDIKDVRRIVGSKYNQGVLHLIEYYRQNFPHLLKK